VMSWSLGRMKAWERKEAEGVCEGEVWPRLWGRKRHVHRVHGPVSCDGGFSVFSVLDVV
jgi:hypothetical protein